MTRIRNGLRITGKIHWILTSESGEVKAEGRVKNLVTNVGDQMYASRGVGLSSSALPTGMKLGTGAITTQPAKSGTGANLVTYLSNSNQPFDAGFPSVATGVVTYKSTFAAGKATSASADITEVVIVTDSIGNDANSTIANTIARGLISGVPQKLATDALVITWMHTLAGV